MASDRHMDLRWDLPCHPHCVAWSSSIMDLRTQIRAVTLCPTVLEQPILIYGGDIILEDEPAYDFVGFPFDLRNRRIHYNRACQARDLPSTYSASPDPVQLSGVLARARHTIKKCAYPEAQALLDLRFLWNLAEERGLPTHIFAFKVKFWHLPCSIALRRNAKKKHDCTLPCPFSALQLSLIRFLTLRGIGSRCQHGFGHS